MFEDMLLRSKLYASAGNVAVRSVVLETIFMSIVLDHYIRLLELGMEIERFRAPDRAKEPKGIEKFLQLAPFNIEACQSTEGILPRESI